MELRKQQLGNVGESGKMCIRDRIMTDVPIDVAFMLAVSWDRLKDLDNH